MFKKRRSDAADALLPWYLNHSLPEPERAAVEEQARQQPRTLHAWQAVRLAAVSQPQRQPTTGVRQRLLAQTRTSSRPAWLPLLSGAVSTVLALVLLWAIVQPGIGLQWSVNGAMPAAFRIYRAPLGSDRFVIVRELPAQAGMLNYSYVDTALLPGQTYEYRVEVVNAGTASATIAANGSALLPTQLAIICSSLLIGLAGAYLLRERAVLPRSIHWKMV